MGFIIFNKSDVVGEFSYNVKEDFFTFSLDEKYKMKLNNLPQGPISENTITEKVELSNFIKKHIREEDVAVLEILLRQFNRTYYHYWVSSKEGPIDDYFWIGQRGDTYEDKIGRVG